MVRIFAWEYVTAGGVDESPASASLVAEGTMMVRSLAQDLSRIPGVETIVACHPAVDLGPLPAVLYTIDRDFLSRRDPHGMTVTLFPEPLGNGRRCKQRNVVG